LLQIRDRQVNITLQSITAGFVIPGLDYCQYLLSSQTNYTLTNLAE
jgi:hypothetical protein